MPSPDLRDASRPNVLLLMADQQQASTLDPDSPCHTPHLDALAARGVRFRRAHTPNAVCSPARASLFTGLYPSRHGMVDCTHSAAPDRADLRAGLPFWSQRLHEAGYAGGYYGKWHVERTDELGRFGFDDFITINNPSEYAAYRRRMGLGKEHTLSLRHHVRQPGYRDLLLYGVTDDPVESLEPHFLYTKGIEFIRQQAGAGRPWFCVLSTHEPHDPYVAPRAHYERYRAADLPLPPSVHDSRGGRDSLEGKPGIQRRLREVWRDVDERHLREARACYFASCSFVDEQVGRIVAALEELGQLENTIVLYTADHGDMLGAHGLFYKGCAAYEQVYNIPLVVAGPGVRAPGRTSEAHVSLVDVAPTLVELAGAAPMPDVDGHSLAPLLRDEMAEATEATEATEPGDLGSPPWAEGYAEFHGQRFFYTQRIVWHDAAGPAGPDGAEGQHRWKYIFNAFDVDELYDLAADPHEMTNLALDPAHRPVLEDMATRMWRRARALGDHYLLGAHYGMFRIAPVGPLVAAT